MNLIDRLDQKRIEEISNTIEGLIPERTGQFPFILLHQVRARLPDYDLNWIDVQLAFNYLKTQGKVFPDQDFSHSIIKRAYKSRYPLQPAHY